MTDAKACEVCGGSRVAFLKEDGFETGPCPACAQGNPVAQEVKRFKFDGFEGKTKTFEEEFVLASDYDAARAEIEWLVSCNSSHTTRMRTKDASIAEYMREIEALKAANRTCNEAVALHRSDISARDAENAALRERVAAAEAEARVLREDNAHHVERAYKAEAALAVAEADARRYRWLRDNQDNGDQTEACYIAQDLHGDQWNDAIDASLPAPPVGIAAKGGGEIIAGRAEGGVFEVFESLHLPWHVDTTPDRDGTPRVIIIDAENTCVIDFMGTYEGQEALARYVVEAVTNYAANWEQR